MHRVSLIVSSSLLCAATTAPLEGASHLWEFWEIFSNADGSVQFIELHIPINANSETFLGGKKITSQVTGNIFTFPSNIQGPTGMKYILIATQAFADQPGAPVPDYIIPENFFSVNGDTLKYHIYDTLVFAAGQLPTDCVTSINSFLQPAVNSPKNYAGVEGEINCAAECAGDLDLNDTVDGADIGLMLAAWGTADELADLNGDGVVDGADLGVLLAGWGPCQ